MTINCDRMKDVAFSTAVLPGRPAGPGPQGLHDHRLRQVAARQEGLHGGGLHGLRGAGGGPEAPVKDEPTAPADMDQLTVPNQLDCLVRLQLGQVDAVVTDNALAAGQAAQDPAVELKGDAVHHRVLRRGDEARRRRPGAPGQPGAGRLPRERRPLEEVVQQVAGGRHCGGIGTPSRPRPSTCTATLTRPASGRQAAYRQTDTAERRGDRWASRDPSPARGDPRAGDGPGRGGPCAGAARRGARGDRDLAPRPPGPRGPQAPRRRRADRRHQGALGRRPSSRSRCCGRTSTRTRTRCAPPARSAPGAAGPAARTWWS